ncbi:MAG: peptide ABC transporter permease [Deltaproteobacteria bacterium CG_4_8_14_3_um_filter_45_9]|nr:MAG: peptide ABC transporter permease [Deltaproteobacteria bacterium CG03_land_8_20_14_0_80_45_14]PIX22698.1 MAG: peptide ABC transporter permease [Deltaproteobacteria bacterium CG_4_8_14_3_um_filter_45_9]
MASFILRRLAQMFVTLVGISIISWVIITLAPGGPIGLTLDPKASPKIIEQMMKNYDLDKPIYQQYTLWLKKLFTGKLYSFKDGRPVMQKINERIWNTLLLNLVATIIIFSLAIPLGVFSAKRQYSFLDNLGTFGAYLGVSAPSFWLAYLLILGTVLLFGYPVLGMRSFVTEDFTTTEIVLDRIWHLMLPSIIIAIHGIASLSRYTRSSMLEVIRQDYIRTAKAKGVSEETVYYKHGLRNALLPTITIFGFMIPGLIGGSIIMETVFAWPGIGQLAYQAILARDYPVLMTLNTIAAVLTLVGNFIADILYGIADPRIRYE